MITGEIWTLESGTRSSAERVYSRQAARRITWARIHRADTFAYAAEDAVILAARANVTISSVRSDLTYRRKLGQQWPGDWSMSFRRFWGGELYGAL